MIKNFLMVTAILAMLVGCTQKTEVTKEQTSEATTETNDKVESDGKYSKFGDDITAENAMPLAAFQQSFNEDSTFVKLTGTVNAVCQKKGCWMTLDLDNGETMRVTFKDYGFFVPKDIAGSNVIIEGKASKKITPVDELKHFAEDEGKSAEEIAQITEDQEQLVFEAVGVLLEKSNP